MTLQRRPKGYVGLNHTVHGGDILAVMSVLSSPEVLLGKELVQRLANVQPKEWYPVADLFDLLERLDQKLGTFHLKQVGWTIVKKFHAADAKANFHNAADLLKALDTMYRQNNRGVQIGGWKVLSFDDSGALMEKTTAHHCGMEEGIVEELLRTIDVWSKVSQPKCFRLGADCCTYRIEPKKLTPRWHGRGA